MTRVRNLLLITADQWRADCLSALGHASVKTPHLDALASEGVLFERHYANAAPCAPSRASIHTGLYQQTHRVVANGAPLDRRFTNWAKEARRAGRDPVLFGYTDTAQDPRDFAPDDPILKHYEEVAPGFRSFLKFSDETPREWVDWLRERGWPIPPRPFDLYRETVEGVEWEEGGETPLALKLPAELHDTAYMVDRVISWIQGEGGRPFTVHLSLLRPHPPWVAPAPWNTACDPAGGPDFARPPAREEVAARHPFLAHMMGRKAYRAPDDERLTRRLRAGYYGLMGEVDHHLGRLFAALREMGAWDDTLIIATSDHGEQMGDHWLMSKLGFYEQSFAIPLIVRDPRNPTPGRRVNRFTENVDLMPTMLEAIGAEIPRQCDGRALTPFLTGREAPADWRDAALWEYDFRNVEDDAAERELGLSFDRCKLAVLRGERWKYVHFAGLAPLLFDLQEDPGETVDRARDPACAGVVLECAQALLSRRMENDDRELAWMKATPQGTKIRARA